MKKTFQLLLSTLLLVSDLNPLSPTPFVLKTAVLFAAR